MTPIEGVDYAFPPIPTAAALKAAGKHFACRYGGPGSDSKQLHAAELNALRAAGVDVVANAEGAANGLRGFSAGKSWAQQAAAHFDQLGMPTGRPIYFSVDWDAGTGDWADIDAALRGAASVLGAASVGVYGSYDTVNHCRAAGSARWFWMTYAWSRGLKPPSFVHLYQYKNGQRIGGADCDFTRALLPDFGQWGYQEDFMAFIDNQADFNAALTAWATTDAGKAAIGNAVADHQEPNPFLNWDADPAPSPEKGVNAAMRRFGGDVRMVAYRLFNMEQRLNALIGAATDPTKLAADLAPLLNGVTPAELQAALVAAFKELAGASPAGA